MAAPKAPKAPTAAIKTREEATQEEKMALIRATMERINKSPGIPESARLHLASTAPPVGRLRSGVLTFDAVMGGGYPRERCTQIKGDDSAGKTTACLHAVARCQRDGGVAAWLQGEEWDELWAQRCGVDTEALIVIPGNLGADDALDRSSELMLSGGLDMLIIDSIQALATDREAETDIGGTGYGSGAPQMWGQWYRRVLRAWAIGARTAVIWTSQLRDQPGKFSPSGDTSDGTQIRSLKHGKSIDLRLRKMEVHRDGKDGPIYARSYGVKADKNKTFTPGGAGEYKFYSIEHGGIGWGYDRGSQIVSWGAQAGIITRAGAWYTMPDGSRHNGADALAQHLASLGSEELDSLEDEILALLLG